MTDNPKFIEREFLTLLDSVGPEEVGKMTIRAGLGAIREKPGIVQDVLGTLKEECGECGMQNVPPEVMEPCSSHHFNL